MPPKKKQEEIDLSTLPECTTLRCNILCGGRKVRANDIKQAINNQCNKFMSSIKRERVMQYAKEKGIYVDPATLTDKQKKDAKFMESVNTEFDGKVFGKALNSLVETENVKVRVDKKNQLEKSDQGRNKSVFGKIDWLYQLTDFPTEAQELEGMAQTGNNLDFLIMIKPKLSWANAPELPEVIEEEQEDKQEDQLITQYNKLLSKEEFNQEDQLYEATVRKQMQTIKQLRKESKMTSNGRNLLIYDFICQIDPYYEQQSIENCVKKVISIIPQLYDDLNQYKKWKQDKKVEPLIKKTSEKQVKQQPNQIKAQGKEENVQQITVKGNSITEILINAINSFDSSSKDHALLENGQQQIEDIISGYDFSIGRSQSKNMDNSQNYENIFINENKLGYEQPQKQVLITSLKYPGVKRHMMPIVPTKSQPLRKLHRSYYGQFIPQELQFEEFQRRVTLINFEEVLKTADEERIYDLKDRIYEEHHSQISLLRQLHSAMMSNEYQLYSKYDEDRDRMYLAMMYRNGARRVYKQTWEAPWKVLPNFQNWLTYFKNNDINFNNAQYYDIDYQKISNLEEHVKSYSIDDGGVIISRQSKVSNQTQSQLYAIKNRHIFGLNDDSFYCVNGKIRLSYSNETIINLPKNTIRLQTNGDVVIESEQYERRVYTASGHVIVYGDRGTKILHPDGAITIDKDNYINQMGYGLKNGQLHIVPTLKRKTTDCYVIKRDDNTTIVKDEHSTWVQFEEGTQMQWDAVAEELTIEKQGLPLIKCQSGQLYIQIDPITITMYPQENQNWHFQIQFKEGNRISLQEDKVIVSSFGNTRHYECNLKDKSIFVAMQNELLTVHLDGNSSLERNGVKLNPLDDEENFTQEDILPKDYIEPRLFIINNDNTGVELFSEKQMENYFRLKEHEENSNIVKTNNEIHVLSKVLSDEELNPKNITLKHNINLDIFKYKPNVPVSSKCNKYTVRSLIQQKLLNEQDVQELEQIKSKHKIWIQQKQKNQNQYGIIQHGEQIISSRIQSINKINFFRKRKENIIDPQELKTKAEKQWMTLEKKKSKIFEKDDQNFHRTNKKNPISQTYKWVAPKQKSQNSSHDKYPPVGFYQNYFQTRQGAKALQKMPDWVFKAKQKKQIQQLDPEIAGEVSKIMNNTMKENNPSEEDVKKERYDTVEVQMNPIKEIQIKPSVFTQREIDQQRRAFEEQKKSYQYHGLKRKDFNIYGRERTEKVDVNVLTRTQPISEINQKYLIVEAPYDKKVKISSMRNKLTSEASSLVEMRKQGPHNALLKTIDKKNDYSKLLNRRTMMVQADLNDKLQRDILINPIEANFGPLMQNKCYEMTIQIKNQDVLSQRLIIKKPKTIYVQVRMNEMGPIALGMIRKVNVTLWTKSQMNGKFTDEFEIHTKHEIYHIPVTAFVQNQHQWSSNISKNVRQVIQSSKKSSLPPIQSS